MGKGLGEVFWLSSPPRRHYKIKRKFAQVAQKNGQKFLVFEQNNASASDGNKKGQTKTHGEIDKSDQ
jgi:hypothetical protein